ncbi:MAG: leucine-rich repeat protein [Ruminococcus sp.]|nr:leucine-rich repeat protein [Ruminococcus sp.]
MKIIFRVSALTLVLLIALSALALVAFAEDTTVTLNGFSFTINKSGEATIHGYDGRDSDVVIPQKLMGADVISIDDYAFFNDTAVTSVSFDRATALKTIGINAFSGCGGLTSLTIPAWIEALSFGAFQHCTALEKLTIASGISQIPAQCFYGCVSLKQVSLPESITEIGERAFMNCSGLTVIEIPDTVDTIADNAFDGCDDLVIYCSKDSYALSYALHHDITFVLTDMELITVTYMIGDTDGDEEVTISDATLIQRQLADIPVFAFDEKAADVDGNGLSITDVTQIQRYLAGIDDPCNIGEMKRYSYYLLPSDQN